MQKMFKKGISKMKQKSGVLITGASRGIGRACALLLAGHGFHIFLNSAHHIEALEEVRQEILSIPGGSCELCPGDVGNPDQVRKIFATIASSEHTDGGLDILINNAGISHIGLLSDMTDEEWSRLIATNLSSAFTAAGKPSLIWSPKNPEKYSTSPPCGDEAAHPAKQPTPHPKPASRD